MNSLIQTKKEKKMTFLTNYTDNSWDHFSHPGRRAGRKRREVRTKTLVLFPAKCGTSGFRTRINGVRVAEARVTRWTQRQSFVKAETFVELLLCIHEKSHHKSHPLLVNNGELPCGWPWGT